MSNFQPSSVPDSGIDACSARHDKYLPRSSMVGVKLNTDCVTLPSVEICQCVCGMHMKWEEREKKNIHMNKWNRIKKPVNQNTNKHANTTNRQPDNHPNDK